jgi:hypothetical protein
MAEEQEAINTTSMDENMDAPMMDAATEVVEETNDDAEALNASLDMTFVQEEESVDDSHGSEDLQVTLQEAMALRKNLEAKFEEEKTPKGSLTFVEKIAHFEKKTVDNRPTQNNDSKPPSTIVATAEPQRLKVFLRVRPCATKEEKSTIEIIQDSNGKSLPTTIRTYPPEASLAAKLDRQRKGPEGTTTTEPAVKEYAFTKVLGPETSQMTVYQEAAAPLINGLCQGNSVGQSALLFCYGITNAGKSHTVLGDPRKEEAWGIIPRCLSMVLQKVQNTDMSVHISCFEIYNEQVLDLLPPTDSRHRSTTTSASLKIREGSTGHMVIPGLTEYPMDVVANGLSLLRKAKAGRHTAQNHLNKQSSRSHAIYQITVRKSQPVKDPEASNANAKAASVEEAHFWIVDLAGNERSKRTNAGQLRQKEATYINMSLMNLMRCLTRTEKPYRDSKLTMLFMHHWSNPANHTTMIVNVHAAASDYDETQHVLSYAISSKTIPVVASKAPTADNTNALQYDYDGRRKGKPLTVVQKAANMMRKLSPKRVFPARKRKNQGTDVAKPETTQDGAVIKKQRREEVGQHKKGNAEFQPADTQSQQNSSSGELSTVKMQLSDARTEIQLLESKNRSLTQQMEGVETDIRSEVAEEMLQEMTNMRRRYEDTISKLQDSFTEQAEPSQGDNLERAESKIEEMVEKVEECEEEMARMSRMHQAEVEELQEGHQAELAVQDDEIENLKENLATQLSQSVAVPDNSNTEVIEDLKRQLAASRLEVDQLKRSKEEVIQSYEKLLADEDDEEDDESEEDEEVEEEVEVEEEFESERKASPKRSARQSTRTHQPNSYKPRNLTSVPKPSTKDSDSSTKDFATRQPFGKVTNSQPENDDLSDSDSSFGPSKWLPPRRPTNKDPTTGLYPRPSGRVPAAAEAWCEQKGAWRLSIVNHL